MHAQQSKIGNLKSKIGKLVCRTRTFDFAHGPLVMGILNVTPDSFSDGGAYPDPTAGIQRGLELAAQGADIIDIGGESSRPGSQPVAAEEELARVLPVVRGLAGQTDVPLSIDTVKAEVARQALAAGAQIINDISALRADPAMAQVAAQAGVPVVLMHMRGTPQTMQQQTAYDDLIAELASFFRERIAAAQTAGIKPENIILDPGLGFAKSAEGNMTILKNLAQLAALGHPVLIGPSRKAFIGAITGRGAADRDAGTAGAAAIAAYNGAHILRVHNPALIRDAVQVAAVLRNA